MRCGRGGVLAGGEPGAVGRFVLNPDTPEESELPSVVTSWPLAYGDIVSCRTPGGGGLGPPEEREPGRIEGDLAAGRVSAEFVDRRYAAGAG